MLKAKVEKMELALEKTIKSFTEFQNFAIESGRLPPDVALELSRAALRIMNHSNEARAIKINGKEQGHMAESIDGTENTSSESNGNLKNDNVDGQMEQYETVQAPAESSQASSIQQSSNNSIVSKRSHPPNPWQTGSSISPQPSTTPFPWASSHQNLTFAQRLRLACVERGLQLLSTPNISFPEIHPALSLHLKWMTIHELRTLTEQSLRGVGQLDLYGPIQHPPVLIHPDLYRTVEGNENVLVNRTPSRDVESLVFGRTRTIVETALPGFEGEWLEPIDVQEYLEDKGILIGSAEPTSEVPLTVSKSSSRTLGVDITHGSPSGETQNTTSMFSRWITDPDLPDSEVDSFPSIGRLRELTTSYPAVASLPATQEELLREQAPSNWIYTNSVSSQIPTTNEGKPLTYFNHTLNLQNLIEYLALSAICIGPGPGMRRDDVNRALEHCIVGF
jgi:hypothetical protein